MILDSDFSALKWLQIQLNPALFYHQAYPQNTKMYNIIMMLLFFHLLSMKSITMEINVDTDISFVKKNLVQRWWRRLDMVILWNENRIIPRYNCMFCTLELEISLDWGRFRAWNHERTPWQEIRAPQNVLFSLKRIVTRLYWYVSTRLYT